MNGKSFLLSFAVVLWFGLVSLSNALEKLQFSTSLKGAISYYLPMEVAQENRLWQANGLDVEWVPFGGTAAQFVAVAGGAIGIGLATWDAPIVAADRGAPVIIVAEALGSSPWRVWVRSNSPYRHPRDLKGAKIASSRLGGPSHIYGRIVVKAHGIEKEVKFIGAGGVAQQVAGIKTGAFDSLIGHISAAARPKQEGIIREIGSLDDYLPQPWPWGNIVFGRIDFVRSNLEVTRRSIKAILQAGDFLNKERRWAVGLIKKNHNVSEEAATMIYESYRFGVTGKIDPRAVDNIRATYMEYGILSKKVPPADSLFTNEYVP